jgi:uncharacterized membrane protein
VTELPVIEHGSSRRGGWLRERRLKLALGLAVAEGLLVAVDVIPALLAIIVAIASLALYFYWARGHSSGVLRETFWIVAVWQAIVLLVPVLAVIVGTLALVAVAVIAVIALVALFADRR